jgi:hypothetical protein
MLPDTDVATLSLGIFAYIELVFTSGGPRGTITIEARTSPRNGDII